MQHFFIDADLQKETVLISDSDIVHQIRKVMRLRPGDELILLDNEGSKALCEIEDFQGANILLKILQKEFEEKSKRTVRLYCALTKKQETFELIIQKATELGVSEIVPLITERCQTRSLRKPERLQKIIREAAEQSERFYLPGLAEILDLKDLVKSPPSGFILAGDARDTEIKLGEISLESKDVNIIIGPEGGLSEKELQEIKNLGGRIFRLGKNVLRTETAAMAALSLVLIK